MKNFLKTLFVLAVCWFFITVVEMAFFMYFNYTPIDPLSSTIAVLNLIPAGFLTDYLI